MNRPTNWLEDPDPNRDESNEGDRSDGHSVEESSALERGGDPSDPSEATKPTADSGTSRHQTSKRDRRSLDGETIGGCTILELIGKGATGSVYLAHQQDAGGRLVAVKVRPGFGDDEVALKRFQNESVAAGKLDTPYVVNVLFAGYDKDLDRHFIVMEYVDGGSLAQYVTRRDGESPLETRDVIRLMREASEGLCATEQQGLIHRDIKPQNLLLKKNKLHDGSPDGTVSIKIGDFGAAKIADVEMTRESRAPMTPLFASPEQWLYEQVDHRTDIYSRGTTFFAVLTGMAAPRHKRREPGDAPTEEEFIREFVATTPFLSPLAAGADIPASLDDVIKKMTARRPGDRYGSCRELVEDLKAIEAGDPLNVVLPPTELEELQAPRAVVSKTKVAAGLAAVLTLAAFAFMLGGSQPESLRVTATGYHGMIGGALRQTADEVREVADRIEIGVRAEQVPQNLRRQFEALEERIERLRRSAQTSARVVENASAVHVAIGRGLDDGTWDGIAAGGEKGQATAADWKRVLASIQEAESGFAAEVRDLSSGIRSFRLDVVRAAVGEFRGVLDGGQRAGAWYRDRHSELVDLARRLGLEDETRDEFETLGRASRHISTSRSEHLASVRQAVEAAGSVRELIARGRAFASFHRDMSRVGESELAAAADPARLRSELVRIFASSWSGALGDRGSGEALIALLQRGSANFGQWSRSERERAWGHLDEGLRREVIKRWSLRYAPPPAVMGFRETTRGHLYWRVRRRGDEIRDMVFVECRDGERWRGFLVDVEQHSMRDVIQWASGLAWTEDWRHGLVGKHEFDVDGPNLILPEANVLAFDMSQKIANGYLASGGAKLMPESLWVEIVDAGFEVEMTAAQLDAHRLKRKAEDGGMQFRPIRIDAAWSMTRDGIKDVRGGLFERCERSFRGASIYRPGQITTWSSLPGSVEDYAREFYTPAQIRDAERSGNTRDLVGGVRGVIELAPLD